MRYRLAASLLLIALTFVALFGAAPGAAAQTDLELIAGFVTEVNTDTITIDGQIIALADYSYFEGEIAVGVFVFAYISNAGGAPLAIIVVNAADPTDGLVRVSGEVSALDANAITVGNAPARLTQETEIIGTPQVGAQAQLVAEVGNFELIALSVDTRGIDFVVGFITALDDSSVTLNGTTVVLTPETFIFGDPALDALYVAIVRAEADGTIVALYLIQIAQPAELGLTLFVGTVTALDNSTITVDTLPFTLSADSYVAPLVEVGAPVSVIARPLEEGSYEALVVRRLFGGEWLMRTTGTVTALTSNGLWIDNHRLTVDAATQFDVPVAVGERVHITADKRPVGDPLALRVRHLPDQPIIGTVTGLGDARLLVDGTPYAFNADTLMRDAVAIGDRIALSVVPGRAALAQALVIAPAPLVPTAVTLSSVEVLPLSVWPIALLVLLGLLSLRAALRRDRR